MLHKNFVPREFLGQARVLRGEVLEAEKTANQAIFRLVEPIKARLRRKRTMRPEMMQAAIEAWAKLPDRFRLCSQPAQSQKNHTLILTEYRLRSISWQQQHWSEETWEPGTTLGKFVLSIEKGSIDVEFTPLVALSLHALGRRYERGFDRSQASVVHDILNLHLGEWRDRKIITDSGVWLGRTTRVLDELCKKKVNVRSLRTFVAIDDTDHEDD